MGLKKNNTNKGYSTDAGKESSVVEEAAIAYNANPGAGSYLGIAGGSFTGSNRQTNKLKLIRGGLTRGSLDTLMHKTGLSIYDLADILEVTDRTLRRYTSNEVLNKRLSERAIEIAQLYSRGQEVFGDEDSFKQWMQTEVPALGHQLPKSFLDTSLGIQMLMDELGRIEHGVYA